MQLQVTHETRYDYTPAVSVALHIAYLQPLSTPRQQLLGHRLHVSPEPAQQLASTDVYGNARQFFALQYAHTQLQVTATSIVATRACAESPSDIRWETVRNRLQYSARTPFDAAAEFVFASPHAARHSDFADFARISFAPGRPLLLAARDLMHRIHHEMAYETHSTQVNTPARQALAQRKGVCQDFAHIMVACLRSLGLPARYVSGYLLTQPAPGETRLIGGDASHAWASVYLPDLDGTTASERWHDFDPTNNRDGWGSPGEDYVTLAVGRDFADVSPIRGVIHGGAHHTLTVGVTVEPYGVYDTNGFGAPNPNSSQSQSQSQSGSQSQSQSQSQTR